MVPKAVLEIGLKTQENKYALLDYLLLSQEPGVLVKNQR
jgi:hypothetical protein